MSKQSFAILRNWRDDRRGSISVLSGTIMIVVIGLGGLALQEALLFEADIQLQNGAEMAALAGARGLTTSVANAKTVANTYTASNLVVGQAPTSVTGYPMTTCLTSAGGSCSGSSPTPNAVVVQNQVSLNLLFGGLFGTPSKTLYSTATASAAGGPSQSADVVLIIDTTASMNNADASCSINNATSLQCALAGARTMLTNFNPASTQVALMTFPPVSNPSVDYCGTSGTAATVSYKTAAGLSPAYTDYLVVPFSTDYKASSTATTLSLTSNLAKAVGAVSTCAGLQAKGGYGTFYADVIADAQSYLTTKGRAGAQKVIVFLSDGDANASSSNVPTGKSTNQCHQAITAATAATTAGTTVYTAAYGASTALQTGSCSTDSQAPSLSACSTLKNMASTTSTFFPINQAGATSGCTSSVYTNSDAATALAKIGSTIIAGSATPRLWVNGTK
jgi:Flp pilus assembly protein TadG